MFDLRNILKKGDTLTLGGVGYLVTELAGCGANCVVYRVRCEPVEGSAVVSTRIIREYYPMSLGPLPRHADNTLKWEDGPAKRESMKRFKEGLANQEHAFNLTADKLDKPIAEYMWTLCEPGNSTNYSVSNSQSLVLESISTGGEGEFSRANIGLPGVVNIMQSLCNRIATVHEGGYVYGDLKPANVCVGKNSQNLFEAWLIDFDTLRPVQEGFAYDDCWDDDGSAYSEGWAPLERTLWGNCSQAMDVYALGAVFFWLLTGRKPTLYNPETDDEGDYRRMMAAVDRADRRAWLRGIALDEFEGELRDDDLVDKACDILEHTLHPSSPSEREEAAGVEARFDEIVKGDFVDLKKLEQFLRQNLDEVKLRAAVEEAAHSGAYDAILQFARDIPGNIASRIKEHGNKLCVAAAIIVMAVPLFMSVCSCHAFYTGSSEGRPLYTYEEVGSGILGDSIVFNSISDSPALGDSETNFVGARLDGSDDLWATESIFAESGKTYRIRARVCNDNPGGRGVVARGVSASFNLPEESSTEIEVAGSILTDSGDYHTYSDSVVFKAPVRSHLEYVEGSALWENNGVGCDGGVSLDDADVLSAQGTTVGYDELDGMIPGGEGFAGYVSIEVKVVSDESVNNSSVTVDGSGSWAESYNSTVEANNKASFGVETFVRRYGSHTWSHSVEASVGDELEFMAEFENASADTVQEVMALCPLASNLEYVHGSTELYNANHPDGARVTNDKIVTTGNNIGGYTTGSNAYVIFRAKVADDDLQDGWNAVNNYVQFGVGETTRQDFASVKVYRGQLNVNIRMRKPGDDEWGQYLDVGPSDQAEFMVAVMNNSDEVAHDVTVEVTADDRLDLVSYANSLRNGSGEHDVSGLFKSGGVDIGSYGAGQSALISFASLGVLSGGAADESSVDRSEATISVRVTCGEEVQSYTTAVYIGG